MHVVNVSEMLKIIHKSTHLAILILNPIEIKISILRHTKNKFTQQRDLPVIHFFDFFVTLVNFFYFICR